MVASKNCTLKKNLYEFLSILSSYKNEEVYDYSKIETPYSFKLLIQEMEAMSVSARMITS